MRNGTELVARLVEIQRAAGESDAAFASRLGMRPSSWGRIRNGRRQGSGRFLLAVWTAFPELVREFGAEAVA